MHKPVSYPRTALDMFLVQGTWTIWYLAIVFIINQASTFVFGNEMEPFYSSGYVSTNVYMLIIGIIAIYFMPYYVGNGITRKNYFIGGVIAGIALSIVIPIAVYIISLAQKLIVKWFAAAEISGRALDNIDIDVDGNIVGELVQAVILTPFVSPDSNLIQSLALFAFHIFVFYMIGWLIGSAFYRLGVIGGLVSIAVSIALLFVKDSMIRLSLGLPLFQNFSALGQIPSSLAIPIAFAVVLVLIVLIRLLTKRAPIKM